MVVDILHTIHVDCYIVYTVFCNIKAIFYSVLAAAANETHTTSIAYNNTLTYDDRKLSLFITLDAKVTSSEIIYV